MRHQTVSIPAIVAAELAQDNGGVLARSFLIAVLVMAPVALWQWSRVRARRRRDEGVAGSLIVPGAPEEPGHASSEGDIRDDGTLEAMVRRVGLLAEDLAPGEETTVELDPDLTLSGRPAPDLLVTRLLDDALGRSGLEGRVVNSADGRRRLECRRPQPGARLDP